jgi:acetate kinase
VVVRAVSDAAALLVVNVGSSSVKLRLLTADDRVLEERDLSGAGDDRRELVDAFGAFPGVPAVGHRIVHGGTRFTGPAIVDDEVRAALATLVELAPLHQPPALAALDLARSVLPQARHVACFDTAFHATIPPAASTYALPREWRDGLHVRRFGFHGLSHAYAARRAAAILGRHPRELCLVTCHLGAGASLCAVAGGRSIDTTMGFTPLEGLVMATRAGSVDPGLVLWLIQSAGITPAAVEDALERRSGLLGLTGSGDMRVLLGRAAAGDAEAQLGLAIYGHRLRASIASMVASLGAIDALVFTGGVGERAPEIRAAAAEQLGFLGIGLDPEANQQAGGSDRDVSAESAHCRTVVVQAREDLEIAGQVRAALGADGALGAGPARA